MKIISWIQQIRMEREIEESLEKNRIEQLKVWLKTVRDPADIKRQLLQMDKGQRDLLDIVDDTNKLMSLIFRACADKAHQTI